MCSSDLLTPVGEIQYFSNSVSTLYLFPRPIPCCPVFAIPHPSLSSFPSLSLPRHVLTSRAINGGQDMQPMDSMGPWSEGVAWEDICMLEMGKVSQSSLDSTIPVLIQ